MPPTNLGHFFMAIAIGTVLAPETFKELVGRLPLSPAQQRDLVRGPSNCYSDTLERLHF